MKQQNLLINSLQYVAKDLVGNLLFWPLWWYSKGLLLCLKFVKNSLLEQEKRIGLKIWLSNLFKPMYAQYDWQGRLISFFMRLIILIFRAFIFFIWAILMFGLLIVWIFGPLFTIFQLINYFIF